VWYRWRKQTRVNVPGCGQPVLILTNASSAQEPALQAEGEEFASRGHPDLMIDTALRRTEIARCSQWIALRLPNRSPSIRSRGACVARSSSSTSA
jgi:hypothetical protein